MAGKLDRLAVSDPFWPDEGRCIGRAGVSRRQRPNLGLALRQENLRSEDGAKQLEAGEQLAWLASWRRAKESPGLEQVLVSGTETSEIDITSIP